MKVESSIWKWVVIISDIGQNIKKKVKKDDVQKKAEDNLQWGHDCRKGKDATNSPKQTRISSKFLSVSFTKF